MAASSSTSSVGELLPDYVVEALLEDFSESSDGDGEQRQAEEVDSDVSEVDDVFDHYSDAPDDSSDDETREMVTALSFLDAEELPDYRFEKKETVHVNPVFQPGGQPGPTCSVPPGEGKAIDFFQLFYDDTFLGRIVQLTNLQAETRQRAGLRPYGEWRALTVAELKAYYAVRLLIETMVRDRLQSVWQKHANSESWLLSKPGIATVFSRRRYQQITKHLHYCDERAVPIRQTTQGADNHRPPGSAFR